ncbi:Uncharacterised protein [Shigella sonnei]|nr:Uncharacterised protein [Shigella sonnei]
MDNIDRRGDIRQDALNGKRYGFIFIVDNPAHFQRRYAVNFSRGGVRAFSNHLFKLHRW